jgi:hypothetical protein
MHWGNFIWYVFHICSYTFDKSEKYKYINLIKLTGDLLPCALCVGHFREMISKIDLNYYCDDKDRFILLLNTLHNKVNKRLDKPIINIDEANLLYDINNIDHEKIIEYIKIIMHNNNLNLVIKQKKIKTINNLCFIFPCIHCRKNLINFILNKPISYYNSNKNIDDWENNIINIISSHNI